MTTPPPKNTPLADSQNLPAGVTDIINAIVYGGNTSNNPKSSINVSTKKTKLTPQAALDIMKIAAESAGYPANFSKADVAQFIKEFDAEQALRVEKVVTSTAQKMTSGGTTAEAVDKTMETTSRTEYPSSFNPGQFAQDWIWKKVDFSNEKSLGAKALTSLAEVRGLVDQFQLFGVSDKEARIAAKQIAMGKKTLADYKIELQQVAKREYPQFADRFTLDPELTTFDIASPIIGMLAKTWEVDVADIKMDDPIVMSYMNYAGPDGKGQQPSRYDLLIKAKKDPKYQYTQEANENARSAATELARAFGFGI